MSPKDKLEFYDALANQLKMVSADRMKKTFTAYGFPFAHLDNTLNKHEFALQVLEGIPKESVASLARDYNVDVPNGFLDEKGDLARAKMFSTPKTQPEPKKEMRKIFISHSTEDRDIVVQLVKLVKASGLHSSQIFCSSLPGYGIPLGEDFMDYIKKELNNDVIVAFVLSSNFYSSAVSLCEMGAAWVNTKEHFPILIPPFEFSEIKGVITGKQGIKINEKLKINELKEKLEEFFSLKPVNSSAWESERDEIIEAIDKILGSKSGPTYSDIDDLEIFKDSNDISKDYGVDDEIWEDKIGPALERLEAKMLVTTHSAHEVDYPVAGYLTPLGAKLRNEKFGNPKKKA